MYLVIPVRVTLKLNPEKHTVAQSRRFAEPISMVDNVRAVVAEDIEEALVVIQNNVAQLIRVSYNMDPADFMLTYASNKIEASRGWASTSCVSTTRLVGKC